jgi:hypothetical protein
VRRRKTVAEHLEAGKRGMFCFRRCLPTWTKPHLGGANDIVLALGTDALETALQMRDSLDAAFVVAFANARKRVEDPLEPRPADEVILEAEAEVEGFLESLASGDIALGDMPAALMHGIQPPQPGTAATDRSSSGSGSENPCYLVAGASHRANHQPRPGKCIRRRWQAGSAGGHANRRQVSSVLQSESSRTKSTGTAL